MMEGLGGVVVLGMAGQRLFSKKAGAARAALDVSPRSNKGPCNEENPGKREEAEEG